ncbi:two-component sensor histidine kinase [Alsobacter soli]|uniref:histidine kinase n=1 Tax=Alsobacter soli TaxID=2109933 RepID=A0A2T1HNX3_9HYPH|nr:PAS-domain containing protein [Alsobacter soli]PSC03352.1 two-component sensor histidine kinase [Alsobacter soli]
MADGRQTHGIRRDRPSKTRAGARLLSLLASTALATGVARKASAASLVDVVGILPQRLDPHGAIGLAVFAGLVMFATTTALIHLGQRRKWGEREAALAAENADLRARCDRADILLAAEPQVVIAWGGRSGEPDIEGDVSIVGDMPVARRVLGFGSWLPPAQAQAVEQAVDRLKQRGESFKMTVRSVGGRILEAEGRPVMGRAVLRIREISGDRLELLHLRDQVQLATADLLGFRAILDALPQPLWRRDLEGRLTWVNAAYARAVEAPDADAAVAAGLEFLDKAAREDVQRARSRSAMFDGQCAAVAAGQRRIYHVLDVATGDGSVGMATDVSDREALRLELARLNENHAVTLDQLPTAVAVFDSAKRLRFCNAAYRDLWQLSAAFLDTHPTDGEILDRLRSERRLPEQADYRGWKKGVLEAYRSLEPKESSWYLPDGRTLRVVTNPNPDGGVTYLFDDVTERFQLKTQFNALMRVQGETLDTLKEGVAVFGTDGRLKLHNPAFASMWRLAPSALAERPHIESVIAHARELHPEQDDWNAIRGAVAGLSDSRQGVAMRMERRDGSVLDCAAAPLPDGATLITFVDVTASVNVERALKERNEALEKAGQLRESFVHHVSYELRSPLTNVIGFTQLLAEGAIGPLNERQKEYAGHILRSSAALMAIIDDILDLATIDTGEMALQLGRVDIRETIEAAVAGVQDRIAENKNRLVLDVPASIGAMVADGKRVRQVLFNLLSNAVGFSREGQTVTLSAERTDHDVVFRVRDEGQGIPPELIDKVFDRFESHSGGSRHRGVGLGLSIVRSFVELHGGKVSIASKQDRGTVVTCVFPVNGVPSRAAAE